MVFLFFPATGSDFSSVTKDAMAATTASGVNLELVVSEAIKITPPDAAQRQRRMRTYVDRRVRKLDRKIEKGEDKLRKMKNEKRQLSFEEDTPAVTAASDV